jgi:hypothetical protein
MSMDKLIKHYTPVSGNRYKLTFETYFCLFLDSFLAVYASSWFRFSFLS